MHSLGISVYPDKSDIKEVLVAVLFAENAALLSILPEEAVPAICRAGSMVADTVHRDGQNFFHR